MVLAFVPVVVAGELEDPVWVYETDVVDVVSGALDDLVVNHPLGVYHAGDGGGVQGKPLLRPDVEVGAVPLDLRNVCEVTSEDAPQDGLMLVLGGLHLVDLPPSFSIFKLHFLCFALEAVKSIYLA